LNIFFDVDQTIISSSNALRPGVVELFEAILSAGHSIYLWSGIGPRHEVVRQHALEAYVSGCFEKPLARYDALLRPLGIPVRPDYVVDDHQSLVLHFGGTLVSHYLAEDASDRELARVAERLGLPPLLPG
jgi:hypothetical protein